MDDPSVKVRDASFADFGSGVVNNPSVKVGHASVSDVGSERVVDNQVYTLDTRVFQTLDQKTMCAM